MIRPDSVTADAVKVRRTIANSRSVRTKDANTAHLLGLADGECRRAQAEGVVDTLEYTVERHDPGGHATADRYVLKFWSCSEEFIHKNRNSEHNGAPLN